MQSLHLISFDLCPFVQRAVIALEYTKTPYEVTYIDLDNPPEWFSKLSPLGKVPCLKVGDEVLFESSVINEFIDEVSGNTLSPKIPLQRAKMRAWIEFSSELLFKWYQMAMANDRMNFEVLKSELVNGLERVEPIISNSGTFNGEFLSLADCAFLPLLQRIQLIDELYKTKILIPSRFPKLSYWAQYLLPNDWVVRSIPEKFEQKMSQYFTDHRSYLAR